ncbi:MAG: protein-export membrane protein SecF [Elusimicrobia bacterium RIFOXYB2_FULL_48_7]|nr:MAG: protein-export membrane protein SecF [Elusimicrobia bacterium RIFOXYB2_FULL_48_7]
MRLLKNANIDFISKRHTFFAISAALILITVVSILMHKGLNLGIDFTGGLLVEVKFTAPLQLESIRKALNDSGVTSFELQSFPSKNSIHIRVQDSQSISAEKITAQIKEGLSKSEVTKDFTVERAEFVGPSVSKHLSKQATWAILLSFVGIIAYVAFRFKSPIWGIAGVLALVHDVVITIGLFSLFDREITLNVVAALLTLAGFSINDTIVIYDRIRENISLLRKESLANILNISVNQTLSRTIITSLTVEMVLLTLFFFGGDVIHDFSLALLFGCIIGTYSTVFVASPLVYEWTMRRQAQRAAKKA